MKSKFSLMSLKQKFAPSMVPMRRYLLHKSNYSVSMSQSYCIHIRQLLAFVVATTAILTHISPINAYAQTSKSPDLDWGVVLGADKTPKEAAKEVADNTKILGQAPRMFLCNGWVRTVAVFTSKQDAIKALRKARAAGSRYSPYIVSIGQWCPGKKPL